MIEFIMRRKTILTCAVTGNITKPEQTPALPITPEQIADACITAGKAGAAIAHIHVRDPQTGAPSMRLELYQEVVERIRESGFPILINLTTGPGGRFIPSAHDPKIAAPGSSLTTPDKRIAHILKLRPDLCSLDLNTMYSGSSVVINTPRNVAWMARQIREAGVKPELEVFDSGDIHLAHQLLADGLLDDPPLFQVVTGVRYGFNSSPQTLTYVASLLPSTANWAAFGLGRFASAMLAQAWLLGGHVRVGLEDNIYVKRGVLAKSNAELVERAVQLIELLGGDIASPEDARQILALPARSA